MGLSSWHPSSQLLYSRCHLIHLAKELLIPVFLSVTNQHYSCWVSLQGSQDSLASSFLKQSTINANHGECGVMQCSWECWVTSHCWPCPWVWVNGFGNAAVFKDVTGLFKHSSLSHICVKCFAMQWIQFKSRRNFLLQRIDTSKWVITYEILFVKVAKIEWIAIIPFLPCRYFSLLVSVSAVYL